jgi:hypothetical protein
MRFSSHAVRLQVEEALAHRFPAALSFVPRPQAEIALTGIAAVDAACGGLPRGGLTELCGPKSSGRTTVLLSLLAQMTRGQEACAVIDAGDSFHPHSALVAGVDPSRLLWVRCSPGQKPRSSRTQVQVEARSSGRKRMELSALEQALKAADQVLQGGGFGLVVMDLASLDPQAVRRVPLASWFRFRRAVEDTPTIFLVLEKEPSARTCASLVLQLRLKQGLWNTQPELEPGLSPLVIPGAETRCAHPQRPSHSELLCGMEVEVEVGRKHASCGPASAGEKKPASVAQMRGNPSFRAKTEWAV